MQRESGEIDDGEELYYQLLYNKNACVGARPKSIDHISNMEQKGDIMFTEIIPERAAA